ncbi:MAG TPA: MFS transporter [Acidimicrobiia bacterium]|nr:MFS transporter [Acidimicrobiia bacterium]
MGSRHQVRLLFLSVAMVTVSTLPVFLTGAAFFQIGPELGIGPFGLGAMTAAFFLTAAVSSPGLGRWVQRVGWRRAMRVNVAASATVVALIAPLARTAWSLGLMLVAAAVMYGSSNPAANQALARHTHPSRTATVFGLKHAGIPVSTLLAGLAVPVVVVDFGWRPAFLIAALLALLVWLLIPAGTDETGVETTDRRTGAPLAAGELHRLAAVAALGAVAAVALGTFMVSAALETGFSEPAAGWLQFAGSGASVTARIVAGVVVDRRGGALTGLVALLGVGAVVFLILPWTLGALFAVAVLAAYATGWGWPGLMTATVVGADRQVAAATSAVTQAGVFVGAGGGPLVLGAVVERWSFSVMWGSVSVCLGAGAYLAWSVAARLRRPIGFI